MHKNIFIFCCSYVDRFLYKKYTGIECFQHAWQMCFIRHIFSFRLDKFLPSTVRSHCSSEIIGDVWPSCPVSVPMILLEGKKNKTAQVEAANSLPREQVW